MHDHLIEHKDYKWAAWLSNLKTSGNAAHFLPHEVVEFLVDVDEVLVLLDGSVAASFDKSKKNYLFNIYSPVAGSEPSSHDL